MKMQNRAVHVQGCNLKVCDLSVGPGSHTTDCHKLMQWVVFVALVHASCQKFSATVGLTLESLFLVSDTVSDPFLTTYHNVP